MMLYETDNLLAMLLQSLSESMIAMKITAKLEFPKKAKNGTPELRYGTRTSNEEAAHHRHKRTQFRPLLWSLLLPRMTGHPPSTTTKPENKHTQTRVYKNKNVCVCTRTGHWAIAACKNQHVLVYNAPSHDRQQESKSPNYLAQYCKTKSAPVLGIQKHHRYHMHRSQRKT